MTYDRFYGDKLLYYRDRLDAIRDGEEPYPLDWHVFPSNVCNHQCVWCMYRQPGPGGEIEQLDYRVQLPRPLLLRAVDEAAATGAVFVHFSGGGEPLINKATPEAMRRARDAGLTVAISTNGRLLTPEVAAIPHHIRVSLNAGTAAQHTATNHAGEAPGDWDAIVANLHAAARARTGDMGLGFVVDHLNYQDIPPFVDLAAEVGVDFVHIRPAFYWESELDAQVRAAMPAALALCQAAQARHAGGRLLIKAITEKFDGFWTPRAYDRCRAVWTGTTLRATGDFAVCQDRTDLVFGRRPSWRDGAPFAEVWHSDERRALVARLHADAELRRCPRCVWNRRNALIDAHIRDDLRLALV